METVHTVAELRRRVVDARGRGLAVALVPTMGALHEGHLALVRGAAGADRYVVVSIFVNPTQFAPGEDYDAYPRDLRSDEDRLASLGPASPALVYAPSVEEMYPGWRPGTPTALATTVSVRGLTERLCGLSRPGHFDGVTTVVSKLLHQVRPDVAFFGRKDFQQLQVIRRMVRDLDEQVEVVGLPTVREEDGVAMSSRNAYLSSAERVAARSLSRGLAEAVRTAREARADGREADPTVLRDVATATIGAEPRVRIDYVDVVDPDTLAPPDRAIPPVERERGEAGGLLVAVAAHVGPARLIDNVLIGDADDERRLLDAVG